jgi:hypothetical protein
MVAILMWVGTAEAAEQQTCTRDEAMQAEDEAVALRDWTAVYRSFKRYAHCDDGAISEGYSDSIARLLTREWKRVGDLERLTASDKSFEQFILHHIDETDLPEELKRISENARMRCPPKATRLCRLIAARVRELFSR